MDETVSQLVSEEGLGAGSVEEAGQLQPPTVTLLQHSR